MDDGLLTVRQHRLVGAAVFFVLGVVIALIVAAAAPDDTGDREIVVVGVTQLATLSAVIASAVAWPFSWINLRICRTFHGTDTPHGQLEMYRQRKYNTMFWAAIALFLGFAIITWVWFLCSGLSPSELV